MSSPDVDKTLRPSYLSSASLEIEAVESDIDTPMNEYTSSTHVDIKAEYPPRSAIIANSTTTTSRRRSSAHVNRPASLASLHTSTGGLTPLDLTGSKTFLLPSNKPGVDNVPDRPLAALERDFVAELHRSSTPSTHAPPAAQGEIESGQGLTDSTSPESGTTPAKTHLDSRGGAFKALFVVVTCSAQLVAQAQFGMVMMPLYEIGAWLGTDDQGQLGWMAASYGLTVGMFLVLSGSLGDLYGPKLAWLLGFGIVIVANIGSGFCRSPIPFNICRALGGIGAALALPNAVAILGRTYPPGPMRSIVFAILGALAPVGFVIPGAYASLLADFGAVQWIWFSTAIIAASFAALGVYVLPPDDPIPPASSRKSFDYLGALLLLAGLGLFNFTWNQAPLVGWQTSYVWASLIVSVGLFVGFYFWERRMGTGALVPVEVLGKTACLVYASLWLGWVSFGVFMFYTVMLNVRETHTALGAAAQMLPFGPCGVLAALMIPWLITRLPGNLIFLCSMIAFLAGNVIMSVAPAHASYWATVFPACAIVVFGTDLSFSTGQLIVSNSVDRRFQGIAGGIVSMITNYSMSIGLGMASTVEIHVAPNGPHLKAYRSAFYFATGLAALAVVVVGFFIRMPKMAHHRE